MSTNINAWENPINKQMAANVVIQLEEEIGDATIRVINARVNEIYDYIPDVTDYWQTPKELKASGAGDCEDTAISKYFELTGSGLADDVRLAYCITIPDNEAHMVCLADGLVLDSTVDVKPIKARKDLAVVYTFNHDGAWVGDKYYHGARIKLWDDLLQRMGEIQ